MYSITFETNDPKILEALKRFARSLGINSLSSPQISHKKREMLLDTIDKGGDMSYIPDPVAWQRDVRKDR